MEGHIYLSLRKLITRVPGLRKLSKVLTKYRNANMAEQEEDFSSLPLPDRFQHKVFTALFLIDV
jgi:hypothetical protein